MMLDHSLSGVISNHNAYGNTDQQFEIAWGKTKCKYIEMYQGKNGDIPFYYMVK